MDTEQVKGKPLTKEETKALLELIEVSKYVNNKTTNATSNKLKVEEWNKIAAQFNASATMCRRTPQQLRLKWENLKKNARKRTTKIRMNSIQTGGGPGEYIPPDEILDRVSSLLGSTASGFEVPFGGDRIVVCRDGSEVTDDGEEECSGSAIVNLDILDVNMVPVPSSSSNDNVLVIQELPVDKTRKLLLGTKKSGKKRKNENNPSTSAKHLAIIEYLNIKKEYIGEKNEFFKLSNEKLKLENEKLKLEIENMKNIQ